MRKKNNSKFYYNRNQNKTNIKTKNQNNSGKKMQISKKKNLKGHNPSGNSISADLSQFRGTSFEEASKLVEKFLPSENEFQAHKNRAKNVMTQRIRYSVKKLNLLKPISKNSKNIIFEYLKNNNQRNLLNNVSCIINAYNRFDEYELNPPKYEGNNKDKVLQHLNKDFNKAIEKYIVPAKKHAENKLMHCSNAKSLVEKYQILLDSLNFFYEYMYKSITEYLPDAISCDCVSDALNSYNIDLRKYYIFDDTNNQYICKSKLLLCKIEEDCATYIICFCI